ncbi:MAG: hypothetical protein ACE5I1_06620 [bacterium]
MKVEIKLDEKRQPFFIERRSITSGKIVQSGFPEYGVVFTGIGRSNEENIDPPADLKPSEDDFDVNLLPGAILGWRSATDEEDHKYFEILGGYFYNQGGPNDGKTTKVFGIVKKDEFGVTEGGTTTVDGKWELTEPDRHGLNEKDAEGGGWTIIVGWKDGGEFPHSSTQLKICVDCPDIDSVAAGFGDCELDAQTNTLRRKVILKASVSGGEAKNWTWHFGNGETKSGEGKPPESVEFFYEQAPDDAPKFVVTGSHSMCQEVSKEVDFSGFKECPKCPEIDSFVAEYGVCVHDAQHNKLRKKVTFKASISGGEPVKWTCEFGDGESESGTGMPPASIEHLYGEAPANAPKMTVEGKAPCDAHSSEADFSGFEACPPCPKVKGFTAHKISEDDQNTVFEFKVETEDGAPDKYEWEWGDGTAKETTTGNTATHKYERQVKSDKKRNVKVTLAGPQECRAEGQTSVEVPEKPITEPPVKPCTWLHLLVAFLLAMAGGNLILWIASASFYPANDHANAIIAFFIFAVLGVLSIILWFNMVKKEKCARPGICEWKSIAWVVLLAAALVALYIVNCRGADWWIVLIILLFAAAIFILYTWWKKCSADIKAMLLLIAAAAIAAFLVCVFIAPTVLEACLR